MKAHYRHGDNFLKRIEQLPDGVVKKEGKIIAYGEITGHTHRFENDGVDLYGLGEKQYLTVAVPSPLIHEEHHEIIIEPGIYEIIPEREFDYFEEDMRKVID